VAYDVIWKAAISVAGIGGVAFLVLWLLYKDWLKLRIFAQLTKEQTFSLMKMFLSFVFLAVIAAIIAFVTQSQFAAGDGSNGSESKLELVEASFDTIQAKDVEEYVYPTLDVKIRNTGGQAAFVTKATFKIEKSWQIASVGMIAQGKVPPETYPINIPHGPPPFSLEQALSHAIKPADVDRLGFVFTINHGNDHDKMIDSIFLIRGELISNAAATKLEIEPFLFLAATPGQIFTPIDLNGDVAEFKQFSARRPNAVSKNRQLAHELKDVNAKRSKFVEQVIQYYREL